jgi:succinate dehydrogenase hydrophobic anchor subunit
MPAGSPLFVVVAWGIPAAFVWLMLRRPSDRSVAAFAKTYEVALTTGNVDQVRRYIQWTRRWRLGGVVAANALAVLVSMLTQRGGFGWMPLVVGYGAGTLVGELLRPAERSSASVASLERRGVRDFVVPRFLAAVAVVFIAGLIPALFLLLDNPQRSWVDTVDPLNQMRYRPQDWFVLALVAVSIASLAIAWVGTSALAQAPMPADTPDRMAVRHAIRSAAIMSVIGATVMVSGSVGAKLGGAAAMLDGDASTFVQWTNNLASWIGGLGAFMGGVLTLTTIPRLAPFSGTLPHVPEPERPVMS